MTKHIIGFVGKTLKIIGIILLVIIILVILLLVILILKPFVPNDYTRTTEIGGSYHALFRKGSENKVLIYFAGGGASVNEETARDDTYNTKEVSPDILANVTMNM